MIKKVEEGIVARFCGVHHRRPTAIIMPGLLMMLLAFCAQLTLHQKAIEAEFHLVRSMKKQTQIAISIDNYAEIALRIDPMSPPPINLNSKHNLQVKLKGGLYNLSHALDWNGISPMAVIDKKQVVIAERVFAGCGLSPDLAIPILEKARATPISGHPINLLTFHENGVFNINTLRQLSACAELRPYLAKFELLHSKPEIGASLLGINRTDFNRISSQIRRGLIANRSALKLELEKINPVASRQIDYNSLSLSTKPNWWNIELTDAGRVFASFTIYERPSQRREIVASQIFWVPEFGGSVF